MDTEFEELLRAGMDRFTASAHVHGGLAAELIRRQQRRLVATRAGAGAGAVVLAAGAVLAIVAPSHTVRNEPAARRQAVPLGAVTLASMTTAAVDAASLNRITYTRTMYPNGATGAIATIKDWSYGTSQREEAFNAAGSLTEDDSAGVRRGTSYLRQVDYTTRAWAQTSAHVGSHTVNPTSANAISQLLRSSLKPGAWNSYKIKVANTVLDGRHVIKATASIRMQSRSTTEAPPPPPTMLLLDQLFVPGVTIPTSAITWWIDPATYLPIQETVTGHGGQTIASTAFSWLAPGQDNLAKARTPAPIPAGFHRVEPPTQ